MGETARISFTVGGNTFEISGPEQFVTAQAEAFRETLIEALTNLTTTAAADVEGPPAAEHKDPVEGGKVGYPNVIHVEGDKVDILKGAPGNSTNKRAANLVLVYLWAKRELGVDSVGDGELKALCEHHGCLDIKNFFAAIRNCKQFIRLDEGTKICKLTQPGIDRAKALLEQMNG